MIRKGTPLGRFVSHAVLLVGAVTMFFPLVWMFLLSISDNPPGGATLGELFSKAFTLSNYTDALASDNFDIYFLNSLLVATDVSVANCLL